MSCGRPARGAHRGAAGRREPKWTRRATLPARSGSDVRRRGREVVDERAPGSERGRDGENPGHGGRDGHGREEAPHGGVAAELAELEAGERAEGEADGG